MSFICTSFQFESKPRKFKLQHYRCGYIIAHMSVVYHVHQNKEGFICQAENEENL